MVRVKHVISLLIFLTATTLSESSVRHFTNALPAASTVTVNYRGDSEYSEDFDRIPFSECVLETETEEDEVQSLKRKLKSHDLFINSAISSTEQLIHRAHFSHDVYRSNRGRDFQSVLQVFRI